MGFRAALEPPLRAVSHALPKDIQVFFLSGSLAKRFLLCRLLRSLRGIFTPAALGCSSFSVGRFVNYFVVGDGL
jgi:hypothetical protein